MLSSRFPVPLTKENLSPPSQPKTVSSFKCFNAQTKKREPNQFPLLSCRSSPSRSTNIGARSFDNTAAERGDRVVADLPEGLQRELMPKHVAVIMDGNRRWAKQRGLSAEEGHRAGQLAMKQLTRLCYRWGVEVLTLFLFSTENWMRPKEEIELLMKVFREETQPQLNPEESMRKYVRRSTIGSMSGLPTSLQILMSKTKERSKHQTGSHSILAINYGGRYDILQACRSIASKVKDGVLQIEDITENVLEQELETRIAQYPNPDLLIRTSGERRISNFMLWQLAYTELYFTDKLFPDFSEPDFIEALKCFQNRQRRFGGQ